MGRSPNIQRSREAQLRAIKNSMLRTAKRFQRAWQEKIIFFFEALSLGFYGTNELIPFIPGALRSPLDPSHVLSDEVDLY
jgi:hypothetical protein